MSELKEKVRRTYRACEGCKKKKQRCQPGSTEGTGPCARCLYEGQDCRFAEPSSAKYARRAAPYRTFASLSAPSQPPPPTPPAIITHPTISRSPSLLPTTLQVPPKETTSALHHDPAPYSTVNRQALSRGVGAATDDADDRVLLSSTLRNPSDALRMLVEVADSTTPENSPAGMSVVSESSATAGWSWWAGIKLGLITQGEAEYLLGFFRARLAPLYPLLPDFIFQRLPELVTTESFLLGAILAISARHAELPDARAELIHSSLSVWIHQQLMFLVGGSMRLRHISSVEALLLLAEWPPLPPEHEAFDSPEEDVLRASTHYDALSWSFIGNAVRIAQELGLDNISHAEDHNASLDAGQERILRTWIFAYNADRHISVRLGRAAVVQAYVPSQWWERLSLLAIRKARDLGLSGPSNAWSQLGLPEAMVASLLSTCSERLYVSREVTASILKSGTWEGSLRSIKLEVDNMRARVDPSFTGKIGQTLYSIEVSYSMLYGNAISLRALQERLKRGRETENILYSTPPSLLNLAEGPPIIDAIGAAQSILHNTVDVIADDLRLCPARIFQRVIFAASFIFKALAVGVVEHGHASLLALLAATCKALESASGGRPDHIATSFAALLSRPLARYCVTPASGQTPVPAADTSTAAVPSASSAFTAPSITPALPPSFSSESSSSHNSIPPTLNDPSAAPPLEQDSVWLWDFAATEKEQDDLFASLWGNIGTGTDQVGTAAAPPGLVGTLCGDDFAL